MRVSLIAFVCVLMTCLNARESQAQVLGMKDYVRPVYLVIGATADDPVSVRGIWISEMRRAGYNVLSWDEYTTLLRNEKQRVLLSTLIASKDSSGVKRDDLPQLLRMQGEYWSNGYGSTLTQLIRDGLVEQWEVVTPGRYSNSKSDWVRFKEGATLPAATLNAPHTFHKLSYNYIYRESLSCNYTLSEIHGSINDITDGRNEQMVRFDFEQSMLATDCPNQIIGRLARSMTPLKGTPTAAAATNIEVKRSGDASAVASISTIVLTAKPGKNCDGAEAEHMTDALALGLLETFDIVDRSALDLAIKEQELGMTGLVRDEDWIQAGALAGAEAILTLQAMCLGGSSILKAKLISAESSLLLLSAIGTGVGPDAVAQKIADAHAQAKRGQ